METPVGWLSGCWIPRLRGRFACSGVLDRKVTIMIGLIISLIIIGLIAGAVARLVVPGRQNISILMTIVLGIVGSFVGGFLGFLIFQRDPMDGFFQPAGIIGSIIGAIIVLLLYTRFSGRGAGRSVRR